MSDDGDGLEPVDFDTRGGPSGRAGAKGASLDAEIIGCRARWMRERVDAPPETPPVWALAAELAAGERDVRAAAGGGGDMRDIGGAADRQVRRAWEFLERVQRWRADLDEWRSRRLELLRGCEYFECLLALPTTPAGGPPEGRPRVTREMVVPAPDDHGAPKYTVWELLRAGDAWEAEDSDFLRDANEACERLGWPPLARSSAPMWSSW